MSLVKSQLFSNNKHPETNIVGTGYKDVKTFEKTLKLISKRSIIYQKSLINTLYNRAKYSKWSDVDNKVMVKMKKWLEKNGNKKIMFPYLSIAKIKKYEKLADELGVSEASRGKVKSVKSDYGFLVMYKKYGKAKMPFIPVHKSNPTKGDYDILRENQIKAKLAQMKNKLTLYDKNGNPTRIHLALIMNAYSPDPNLP